jgi:hypothetical protein
MMASSWDDVELSFQFFVFSVFADSSDAGLAQLLNPAPESAESELTTLVRLAESM